MFSAFTKCSNFFPLHDFRWEICDILYLCSGVYNISFFFSCFWLSFYPCFNQFMKCLGMIFFVVFISLDKLLGLVGFSFYHLDNFYPLIISDTILTHLPPILPETIITYTTLFYIALMLCLFFGLNFMLKLNSFCY